ncbi:uncharacterized protein LOC123200950 isoform X2 [Mangifera indica]|uniref:uncharacterized protein LOC123200950 isoform X2 n=1 Tax=Mangifera indica TaxID=29780 RepID=UPI001CF96204|nr:uncharacterized protein LOC123200950 isoform X2 [Mangifera indica]
MELVTSSINCTTIFSPPTLARQTIHSLQSQLVFSGIANRRPTSLSFSNIVSDNGYVGPKFDTNPNNGRLYRRLGSCLVIPQLNGKKPRAIIQFLGGAFIGAVPEVTYSYLKELLAKEGFLLISVPHNVTFDHAKAANQVYERFNSCLDTILTTGLPHANLAPADLVDLPIFSVGHSNGALLQVLTGSCFSEKIPKANAIISFNNRPATEAVPYFELLGPLVNQMMPIVEASPVYSMARSASGDAWKVLLDTAGAMIPDTDKESLVSLNNFVDQLPSVFNQVTEGVSEFKPTPSENRDCFKKSYNVQHTLLEPKWQAGSVYTPADAIAQGLKTLSLNEIRYLSKTISDWFRRFED